MVSEAPKKIWYSFEYEKRIIAGANEEDTPYIRADLVDGVIEALKTCRFSGYTDIDGDYITTQHFDGPKIRAALKALEEE
jgi:hypothetical protein